MKGFLGGNQTRREYNLRNDSKSRKDLWDEEGRARATADVWFRSERKNKLDIHVDEIRNAFAKLETSSRRQ